MISAQSVHTRYVEYGNNYQPKYMQHRISNVSLYDVNVTLLTTEYFAAKLRWR
jgi:hypothetical protein